MPFDGTSKRSAGSDASQSTIVLNMMEFFFDGGARWARRTFCTDDGKRCILGALEYVRCEAGQSDDRAVEYIARAINRRQARMLLPPLGDCNRTTIIGFNDAFRRSFADVAAILSEAKELATIDAGARAT